MDEQDKLLRLLEMLVYLSSGIRRSISEIGERFDISERTAYRYLRTFREAGFIIDTPHDGLYQIEKTSPYFSEISELLHFSREEAYILQQAIHSISDENLLKQKLVKKLYSIYDFDRVVDTVVKPENSENIHNLILAIKSRRCVILKGYQSANSNIERDRHVEPFSFTTNYVATWAYDLEDGCCKTFKNSRISSIVILKEGWTHQSEHRILPIDVFRISGEEEINVRLELSIRASELLKEEYPMAEKYITEKENGTIEFAAPVYSLEGVGRFVLELSQEIRVIEPQMLKEFIQKKAKNILLLSVIDSAELEF